MKADDSYYVVPSAQQNPSSGTLPPGPSSSTARPTSKHQAGTSHQLPVSGVQTASAATREQISQLMHQKDILQLQYDNHPTVEHRRALDEVTALLVASGPFSGSTLVQSFNGSGHGGALRGPSEDHPSLASVNPGPSPSHHQPPIASGVGSPVGIVPPRSPVSAIASSSSNAPSAIPDPTGK